MTLLLEDTGKKSQAQTRVETRAILNWRGAARTLDLARASAHCLGSYLRKTVAGTHGNGFIARTQLDLSNGKIVDALSSLVSRTD